MVCLDTLSGRVFETELTEEELKVAAEKLNNKFQCNRFITVKEYYEAFMPYGMFKPYTTIYDKLYGWQLIRGSCGHFGFEIVPLKGTDYQIPIIVTPSQKES